MPGGFRIAKGGRKAFDLQNPLIMNETFATTQKPDPEEYARLVLYQLAALRAEGIQTQSIVTQILSHHRGENHERYLERILDQETRKAEQIDRIYRNCLELAKIPYKPMPTERSQE